MRRQLTLAVVLSVLTAAVTAYVLRPHPPAYSPGLRSYKIMREGKETLPLRADRIERKDGCVLFWRQDRIDTVVCEGMGGLVITEIYD